MITQDMFQLLWRHDLVLSPCLVLANESRILHDSGLLESNQLVCSHAYSEIVFQHCPRNAFGAPVAVPAQAAHFGVHLGGFIAGGVGYVMRITAAHCFNINILAA